MRGRVRIPKTCGYGCCWEYNKDKATNGRAREKEVSLSEIHEELVDSGYQPRSLEDYRREYYASWYGLEDLDDSTFVIEEIQEMQLTFNNINYYPA